jgi:hypothetical protein
MDTPRYDIDVLRKKLNDLFTSISEIKASNAVLRDDITALKRRVETLESERPGRKAKPMIIRDVGICGLDPDIDSADCPDASVYRYQQGCRGTGCVSANRQYYSDYRQKSKKVEKPSED